MPAMLVEPDTLTEGTEIRYGTALHRINEEIEAVPLDEDFAQLYAGDIRDALRQQPDAAFKDLRAKVKGKPTGELVSVPLAEARKLVAAALNPSTAAP